MEILRKGVPRELIRDEDNYRDYITKLIDIRNLKYFNEQEVNQTIYLYEMQVKAAIFH